ncbi:MAG: hypothetical protein ACKVVP_20795 [Chloroflexota bacterium]
MAVQTTSERAFFVPRRDIQHGLYPHAQPAVLVDSAVAHRYGDVRVLIVEPPPSGPAEASPAAKVTPLFIIDAREVVLYDGARPAVIDHDFRDNQPE